MKFSELMNEISLPTPEEHEKYSKEFHKEMEGRVKTIDTKMTNLGKQKLGAMRGKEASLHGDIAGGVKSLKQAEGQDGHEFAHVILNNTKNELIKFVEFLVKKLDKYAKEIVDIKMPLPKELADKFASAMTARTTKIALKTQITVSKMLEKEKGVKSDIELMQALSKGAISKEELADIMDKAYPELDPDDIEEFIEKVSTDPVIKDKVFNFNKRIERLADILARTRFMSEIREKTPIHL